MLDAPDRIHPADETQPECLTEIPDDFDLDELAAAFVAADGRERAADERRYLAMLSKLTVARRAWALFSRTHADARTPSDRAQALADFDQWGKDALGLERSQWRNYQRISQHIEAIHTRTLKMQAEQHESGDRETYPGFKLILNDWFPADPVRREAQKATQQAANDIREAQANMQETQRRQELMAAHDGRVQAEQALAHEREERWDEITQRNSLIAQRDEEIARLKVTVASLQARMTALTELPPDDPDSSPPAATQPVQPDLEPDQGPTPVIDPPPDTSTDTAQVIDTPAPEPPTELPLTVLVTPAPEEPQVTFGQAIRAVYALGDQLTCDRVADVLCRLPLAEWNDDELSELARALEGCSTWQDENIESLAHVFVQYADGTLLFCTDDEVLVWEGSENGLQICRWDSVRNMMAPHIAETARRREAQQREQDTKVMLSAKLPPKRKLKAVKDLIDRIIELKAAKFNENAQRAIDHIRQMAADDPRFADCTTLEQYIDAVAGCLSSGSGSN